MKRGEEEVAGNDKSVERALGDLEGTVRAQTGTIKNLTDEWARRDDAATEGRRSLYLRFEALSTQVTASLISIDVLKKDFEEFKQYVHKEIMPTIAAYKLADARRAGMWLMSRLFWAAVLCLFTLIGYAVHEFLQYLHKP